jgi:hypothetical protein
MYGEADKRPDDHGESKAVDKTKVTCDRRFDKADNRRDQEDYADRQAEAGIPV